MSVTAEDVIGHRPENGTDGPGNPSSTDGVAFDDSASNSPRPEQTFFDDPALDRMMGVIWSLATEVYVLRDRLQHLENTLEESGTLSRAALEAETTPEELFANTADRDAFVAHLMDNLLGIQSAKGPVR